MSADYVSAEIERLRAAVCACEFCGLLLTDDMELAVRDEFPRWCGQCWGPGRT